LVWPVGPLAHEPARPHARAIRFDVLRVVGLVLVETIERPSGEPHHAADSRALAGARAPTRDRTAGRADARADRAADRGVLDDIQRFVTRLRIRLRVARLGIRRRRSGSHLALRSRGWGWRWGWGWSGRLRYCRWPARGRRGGLRGRRRWRARAAVPACDDQPCDERRGDHQGETDRRHLPYVPPLIRHGFGLLIVMADIA